MRFLVDGVPAATYTMKTLVRTQSLVSLLRWAGYHFNLNQKLTLSPGTHTIAVQLSVELAHSNLHSDTYVTGFNSALNPVMRTVPYSDESLANVSVSRRITAPVSGTTDFTRTVTHSPTRQDLPPVPVRVMGNLAPMLPPPSFAKSDG